MTGHLLKYDLVGSQKQKDHRSQLFLFVIERANCEEERGREKGEL
jgi:hypothetical protein